MRNASCFLGATTSKEQLDMKSRRLAASGCQTAQDHSDRDTRIAKQMRLVEINGCFWLWWVGIELYSVQFKARESD